MKKYTKKQIEEAIKHWQSVLRQLDESKSPLLDAFAKKFSKEIVFSNVSFDLSDRNIKASYDILNELLFNEKLHSIPVKCMTYKGICAFDSALYNKYKKLNDDEYINPPIDIYGMHSAFVLNDVFKYDEPLVFADEEIIYLNLSQLKNASFSLCISSLCHEMIHYYDRLYGEYQDRYKAYFISGANPRLHDTDTFEEKMKEANDNYLNVVKVIPKNQTVSQSNDNAIELALKALEESDNGLSCALEKSTPIAQFVGNRRYIMIHDFD